VADSWVTTTVDEVADWAADRGEQADLAGVRILLELAEGIGVSDAARIGPDELREVLVTEFPEQVSARPEDVPAVLGACTSLVDFLEGTAEIGGQQAADLRSMLVSVEPEFEEAVAAAESGEGAAAELFFTMMRDEDVDITDDAAVKEWITAFQELSDDEQAARALPYLQEMSGVDDDAVVPPVRLAPEAELAAAARASGLAADAVRLAEWAEGRAVGPDGEPAERPDDLGPDAEEREQFQRFWHAVQVAELVVVEAGTAGTGPGLTALRSDNDDAALAAWVRLLDDLVTLDLHDHDHDDEDHDHDHDHELTAFDAVRDALPGILLHVYEQEQPATRAELLRALTEHLLGAFEVTGRAAREWRAAGEHALDLELADLGRWGVLDGDPDGYRLTPLGVWGVRELLLADGYVAPLVGELAQSPADELVAGLTLHRADEADEEIDLWLARREPAEAARELLDVMAAGTPGTRNLAAVVLHRVGMEGEPVVRGGLEDRQLRPYALLWLAEHGDTTITPTTAETLWIFIDTVAGLLETDEPADAIETALADAPEEADLGAMIEEMWRVDHPDVPEVLDALGDHHPDKRVAKAARRAAFKARSAMARN
jgi:hypothetical protein